MPLTAFQKEVMAIIAANRTETSHLAGGLILHGQNESARYSHDFDIFHDEAEDVEAASILDVASLREAGFGVEPVVGDWEKPSTFRKARVTRGADAVDIDWAADSAYRFFPIESDPVFGMRLHLFDMATNKALALAARSETRDLVDMVELDAIYPLEAVIWAACGKDEGFSPMLLLEMMRRFARISRSTLKEIQAREFDPVALKKTWIEMSDRAESEITRVADTMPDLPIGVAFVDAAGKPGWIASDPSLRPHPPSLRGCWPDVHPPDSKA